MTSELGGMSLRMFGSLLAVLGLIMLLFHLARRLRFKTVSRPFPAPQMRLLGTLNIAPKRALALVEFSDQWLIVGVGAESVRLLLKMERVPAGEQDHGPEPQRKKGFRDFLPGAGLLHPFKYRGPSSGDCAQGRGLKDGPSTPLEEPWGQGER